MFSITDWVKNGLIKKYAASLFRKAILALAILITTNVPWMHDLATFLEAHAGPYSEQLASALFSLSLLWGLTNAQKEVNKKDK